jgi:hypothetical protein
LLILSAREERKRSLPGLAVIDVFHGHFSVAVVRTFCPILPI